MGTEPGILGHWPLAVDARGDADAGAARERRTRAVTAAGENRKEAIPP